MTTAPVKSNVPDRAGLKAWLSSDAPTSRGHARAVQFYMGWMKLYENKLAFLGFLIILSLVLMAILRHCWQQQSQMHKTLPNA